MPLHLKEQLYEIIERLPDDAGWDDVFYAMCVRLAAEQILGSPVALPAVARVALRPGMSRFTEEQ